MAFLGTSSPSNPTVTQSLTGGNEALSEGGFQYAFLESTPGITGIIGPVSTTLDETKALMRVYNNVSSGVNISLKALRLHVYTVGTGGTTVHFTQAIDNFDRYSSGGSTLTVNNTNMGAANSSAVDVKFGALTLAAASGNRRFIANTTYHPAAIEVVNDKYQFSWGAAGQLEDPASLINNTTTLTNVSYSFPSVTLGPGQCFVLHQWRASITVGITFGVEGSLIIK